MKKSCFILVASLICFFPPGKILGQTGYPLIEDYKIYFNLYASVQYREIPDQWHVTYYGLTGESYMNTPLGVSGSIFYGRGSNNQDYLHLPPLGVGLFAVFSTIFKPQPEFLIFLMFENLHYNIPYRKNVVLSPYLNLLGMDLSGSSDGETGHVLINSGIGVTFKFILSRHVILNSDTSIKYFWISNKESFGSGNQAGYSLGINLGYQF
jgi:hypothetical protein